jgi:hypothetical protein
MWILTSFLSFYMLSSNKCKWRLLKYWLHSLNQGLVGNSVLVQLEIARGLGLRREIIILHQ